MSKPRVYEPGQRRGGGRGQTNEFEYYDATQGNLEVSALMIAMPKYILYFV